ncbi:hypothetical protein C8Q80DRAFT_656568 [Daedaleopsis nitida]|nr:hypothetical protein C8Q80DRAFT_656568 [Daedaleopsis nitida]
MSRVPLSKIKSLTFYSDRDTLSRRGTPIPQLTCVGKPCRVYQPQAVRCTNFGGSGTDVDWKCEADLPDSLRFGKVQVSCEGWNGPGDTHVMKGSCGLEYTLVQIPGSLRGGDDPAYPARLSRWLQDLREDPTAFVFMLLWVAVFALLLYNFLKSCCGARARTPRGPAPGAPPPRRFGSGWFSSGGGGGGGPGGYPDRHDSDAPPPYSKHAPSGASVPGARDAGGWRPGFWTGAALGWLGTQWMNRAGRERERERGYGQGMYDWEAERTFRPARTAPPPASASPAAAPWWAGGSGSGARRRAFDSDDRGEGSSSLGSMRRSTAFGGSSVR